MSKGKLELTWVGKDERPRLEPRVLVEDSEKSFGDPKSENMLIRGDNLLALKALEQDFTDGIQCIYIDPPFNTGQALEHYDDGVEHSLWLSIMRDRIELLHRLLHPTGTIFIHIDDTELAYLIAVADEVFQRHNRISIITFKQSSASGPKAINPGLVTTANYIAVYAKDKKQWKSFKTYTATERDDRYGKYIVNIDDAPAEWRLCNLKAAFAESVGIEQKKLKTFFGEEIEGKLNEFVLKAPQRVVRTATIADKDISEEARPSLQASRERPSTVIQFKREGRDAYFFLDGEQLLFYSTKARLLDGKFVTGEALTNVWTDLLSNNLHNEGGVEFPRSKKPEMLIKRILDMCTEKNDWVLDSFAGSGTTGAVAQKMDRRWIMVEMGLHAETHCLPRMRRVVGGTDQSGATKATGWRGGGGFHYFRLAESLLVRDKDLSTKESPIWIINPKYDDKLLIRSICKIEGFRYRNEGRLHGISSESRFLHVTTRLVTQAYLDSLVKDIGPDQSLLIYCTRKVRHLTTPENVEMQRIPRDLLDKCDFQEDR